MSIKKGHCSLYHKADNNTLLTRAPRRELDGLFSGHIQLTRKIISASVRTIRR